MRVLPGLVLFLAAACSTTASSGQGTLSGTYRGDCAPYDGPAFLITLPLPAARSELNMRANVGIERAAGEWRHVFQAGPGEALVFRCQTFGERRCDYPDSAIWRIEQAGPDRLTGTIEQQFPGEARQSFAFTARAEHPAARLLCG